jgi:hypothetical protein
MREAPIVLPAQHQQRRGGRVVEGARLESVYAGNRIAGSNPAPSASHVDQRFDLIDKSILCRTVSPPVSPPSNVDSDGRGWTVRCPQVALLHRGFERRVLTSRRFLSCYANEYRTPELVHLVERLDGNCNFSRTTGIVA